MCRGVLLDILNMPGWRVKKSSIKSLAKAYDMEYRKIESLPGFLFDLGINQCSLLFQELGGGTYYIFGGTPAITP